ncbi:GmrSD restriction endonuclease domain-containing protein [Aquirufa sp. 5-AUSEE-100C1]
MEKIEQEEFEDTLYQIPEDIGSEDEDDIEQEKSTFSQAVIWGTDWTTETVNSQLLKNNIDLFPKFQRRDAWSNKAKSRFIESLILGLPIPQIILAEKTKHRGKYIVIDGKQRLLTIRRFFSIELNDEFKPLRLSGLEILTQLNGKTYKNIKENPDFFEELNQLENQSIRTVVLKNWPNEEFLYTVFLRLNTGSIKLSPQELRQALHPGPFIDFADEFSINSEQIKAMLNLTKPDYRMRDVEMVIRYFANKYYLKNYNGNLKKAFDETVNYLNNEWNEAELRIKEDAERLNFAIDFTISMYGSKKDAFSKWNGESFQGNFNRAVFDIMVYFFSNSKILEESKSKKKQILESFKKLCENDPDFVKSFEHTTKSIENTFKRITTWGEALSEILEVEVEVPKIDINGQFTTNML